MFITTFFNEVFFPKIMALCESLAPISSVLVFLAPIPTLLQIWRNKSVGDLPLLPYTMMIMNAFLWFTYGFLICEPKIWTANAIGFFVGSYYFLEFIRYSPRKAHTLPGTVTQHFHCCFLLVIGTLVVALLDPSGIIIGHTAVVSCVAMFASPLAALPRVMETKSAEAIPLTYTLAVMTNSILWTLVGLLEMHDIHIYVPTLLGMALSGLQVYLKYTYGNGQDIYTPMAGDHADGSAFLFYSQLLV